MEPRGAATRSVEGIPAGVHLVLSVVSVVSVDDCSTVPLIIPSWLRVWGTYAARGQGDTKC